MRDLYADLGIDPKLPASKIEAMFLNAERSRDPQVTRALAILLKPHRRSQYDRVHVAVSHIAALRWKLELTSTEFAREHETQFAVVHGRSQRQPPTRDEVTAGWTAAAQADAASKQRTVHVDPPRKQSEAEWLFGGFKFAAGVGAFILVVGFIGSVTTDRPPRSQATSTPARSSTTTAPPQQRVAAPAPLALPATGAFDESRSTTRNAIIVKTRAGGSHTLVKIERAGGAEVTRGFVRAGEQHTFNLPLGTYVIKMASGSAWYGDTALFGSDTGYSKADDTFPLNQPGEQWTVELIPQRSGNLRERRISASQF